MEVVKSNIAADGQLRAYSLPAVPDLDTAKFVPGELLREYDSIGAWQKEREKEHANFVIALDPMDVVASDLANSVDPGAEVLSDADLSRLTVLDPGEVRAAIDTLIRAGRLELRDDHRIWLG